MYLFYVLLFERAMVHASLVLSELNLKISYSFSLKYLGCKFVSGNIPLIIQLFRKNNMGITTRTISYDNKARPYGVAWG
jgi:hypothetical protein